MSYTNGLDDPSAYFQTILFASKGAQTFDGNSDLQPDMIWNKNRDSAGYDHHIVDSVRGVSKLLRVNSAIAEFTSADSITSLNTDGFTIGNDANGYMQSGSDKIVTWGWKESATAGFDIVSYTGNSSDGVTQQNISHSLSAVPQVIIIKNRTDGTNWCVYHHKNTSAPETEIIYLNLTNATSDDSAFFGDTAPTSSIFTVGGDNGVNGNGDSMIAYCFAEKKGYSKFGSYTGNGQNDNAFIHTGFKPAFIMIKKTDSSDGNDNWVIVDNKRLGYNVDNNPLYPNTNGAEVTSDYIDFLSNGAKIRNGANEVGRSGVVYIYMAFAENPFVTSSGVPACAR